MEDDTNVEETTEETSGESARSTTAAKPKGAGRPKGEVGKAPTKAPFENKDAELLWPEILTKLPAMNHNVHELVVRVIRVEPPPKEQIGKAFEASAIRGDGGSQIPGDALIGFVTKYYHLPYTWSQGPAQYELHWCWKSTGQIFAHGTLRLPSREAISAAYDAEWRMREDQGRAGMSGNHMPPMPPPPPPQQGGGFGQPSQQQPPQQQPPGPQWPYPGGAYGGYYPGVGAPPGYPPPPGYAQGYPQQPPQAPPAPRERDPEIDRMREEMSEIKALLRESITSSRDVELQEIKKMIAGVGAIQQAQQAQQTQERPAYQAPNANPPPREPPLSQEAMITRAVVTALGALGIVPPAQQQQAQQQQHRGGVVGVGSPAPVGQVAQAAAGLEAIESLVGIFERTKKLTRRLEDGVGRSREEDEEPPPAVETPVEQQQQPQMGVALVDVGTTWRDGRPVKAAVDPETGKFVFDQQGLMGIALGNPIIGEGILDVMQAIKNKVVAGASGGRAGVGAAGDVQVRQVVPQAPELQAPTQEAPVETNGSARTPWVV